MNETILKADVQKIISEISNSIVWKGNSFSCSIGQIRDSDNFKLDGVWEENDVEILLIQTGFNPEIGDMVSNGASNYRIAEIIKDDFGASILLRCKAENK